MKKPVFVLSALLLIALLPACSLFSKYSEVEYNNLIVDHVNNTSLAIEKTATLYNETLPEVVTEKDTLDLGEMQTGADDARQLLADTEKLIAYESRNTEQQTAVIAELQTYMEAGDLYLQSYSEMLQYYVDGTYQDDITQVKPLDEILHTNYTTFIEANNDLVDILESFVAGQ